MFPAIPLGQRYDESSAALERHSYAGAARMFGEAATLSRTRAERTESLAAYGVALHFAERNSDARRVLEEVLASRDARNFRVPNWRGNPELRQVVSA